MGGFSLVFDPSLAFDQMRPVDLADAVLEEFRKLQRNFRKTEDYARFQNDLERWKRRAVFGLSSVVPADDLERFNELSIDLEFAEDEDDPTDTVIDEHDAYLISLMDDMRKYPESYGEKAARKPHKQMVESSEPLQKRNAALRGPILSVAEPMEAQALKLPEHITISWLVQHVPVRFWFYLAGLLAAAFALGVRLARYVGPFFGIGAH